MEPDEDDEATLRRELEEELGLVDVDIGPHIWNRLHIIPFVDGNWDGQRDQVHLVRTDAFEPQPRLSWEQLRAERLHEMRWWTLDEIERRRRDGVRALRPPGPRRPASPSLLADGPPSLPVDAPSGSRGRPGCRPMDAIEARVRDAVAGLPGVEVIDIDPALADTAEFCAAYGYAIDDSANAIVVVGKSDPPVYAVGVVLASTRSTSTGSCAAARHEEGVVRAGRDDRRADGDGDRRRHAFALPAGLPLWIDARVMARNASSSAAAAGRCKVVGPPTMLLAVPGAEVVEDLAPLAES